VAYGGSVMKLYYRPNTSGRPMRAAWLLEELGAEYEAVAIEDTGSDEHRQRSPLGRVPVLEFADGTMLFDSTAILFALADHYREAGFLAPVGTRERDLAYQWSLTAMTELEKAAIGYLMRKDDESRELYRSAAAAFSGALEGREFLVGDSLTVADIVTTGVLFVSERAKLLTEESPPSLQAYFSRLGARPALARAAQRVESVLQPA
jgi:glutathione S-transferase